MKIFKQLIFFISLCGQLSGQTTEHYAIKLSENIDLFKMDVLEQIYTLSEDQYLKKWDKKGNLLFQFINNRDGKLNQIDVRNPLQILLFYSDQQRFITLDRTLTPLKEWQINQEDWGFIGCAATGKNDQIWLFDQFNYQLGSINKEGKIERPKTDLIFCCQQAPEIIYMAQTESHLYLFDHNQGIIQCDLLGQFLLFIPLKEWQKVLTFGNTIWIIKNEKIIEINNDGHIAELGSIKNTNLIVGFNNKEIFLNDGKSDQVIIIKR
jgi:hypothetical protein